MRARARSVALILVGVLASTSSVGIVLWNSQSEGTDEVRPAVDANAEVNAGDSATVDAFSNSPLATLQYDEDLLDVIQAFDPGHGGARIPVSDLVSSTMTPLSVDMGLAHVQVSAATGTSERSPRYANPSYGRALPAALSLRGGGGSAGIPGKSVNSESEGADEVDEPGAVDEPEEPVPTVPSPDEPHNEGPDPTEPDDPLLPPVFNDPAPDSPVHSVPEPGTLGLLMMGVAGLLFSRRKPRASIGQ